MNNGVLTYAAATAVVIAICNILDWATTKEEKDNIKLRLLETIEQLNNRNHEPLLRGTSAGLTQVLDLIYGPKLLSWRAFRVSLLISATFVVLLGTSFSDNIEVHYHGTHYKKVVLESVFIATLICVIPDYFSWMKARKILRIAQKVSWPPTLFWLLLDLALSFLLCATTYWMAAAYAELAGGGHALQGASAIAAMQEIFITAVSYVFGSVAEFLLHPKSQFSVPFVGLAFLSTLATLAIFVTNLILKTALLLITRSKSLRMRLSVSVDSLVDKAGLFVFLGAGACGFIGLIKSVLYMISELVR